jgi:PAS domain S-box-containing protein
MSGSIEHQTEIQRKSSFLNTLGISLAALLSLALLIMVLGSPTRAPNFVTIGSHLALALLTIHFNRRNAYRLAAVLFSFNLYVLLLESFLINLFVDNDIPYAISFSYIMALNVMLVGMLLDSRLPFLVATLNTGILLVSFGVFYETLPVIKVLTDLFPVLGFTFMLAVVSWLYQRSIQRAEQELRSQKEFAETLLNSQQDTFFLFDPATGKAIRWNKMFNEITGYTDEEIARMPAPNSYYSAEDLAQAATFTQKVLETGTGRIELSLICKDGRVVPTEYNVSLVSDETGKTEYMISIGRDVTERKQAEEALQHYVERLRALREIDKTILTATSLETIQSAIKHLDELIPCLGAGFVELDIETNAAVLVEAARSGDLELNIPKGTRFPLSAFEAIFKDIYDTLCDGRVYILEDTTELASMHPLVKILPEVGVHTVFIIPLMLQDDLLGFIGLGAASLESLNLAHLEFVYEVTNQIVIALQQARLKGQLERHAEELEQRVAERTAELKTANEQLIVLSQVKDEFVSNVSHELGSPITSLKLHLHLIEARPEKRDTYLATLKRELKRLENLVESLLFLSRIDQDRAEINLRPVDINKLVGSYITDRQPVARQHDLTLSLNLSPDLPMVQADRNHLGQVVSILLTNAINYTPAGGRVMVNTHARQQEDKQWIGFSVEDTGPGISPEDQAQLFDRFYRGKTGRESGAPGTGLGLAIAKEIIDRHAGQIEVESKGVPGKGARFSIWLPAAEETEQTPVASDPSARAPL